tara:strand:- start:1 stop:315 length:315 start_codon:yes stop_codon:yes gene_type:complete
MFFLRKIKMKKLLIVAFLVLTFALAQNAQAQETKRQPQVVKVLDLGSVVRNSCNQIKTCTQQTLGGIELILRAPFTRSPDRLPLFREYRYYKPIYVPGRWERVK